MEKLEMTHAAVIKGRMDYDFPVTVDSVTYTDDATYSLDGCVWFIEKPSPLLFNMDSVIALHRTTPPPWRGPHRGSYVSVTVTFHTFWG